MWARSQIPNETVLTTEPAQVPFDVRQIKVAGLVHAQPHVGHQPGRRITAGSRRELPAGRQLGHPANSVLTSAADGGIRSAARPAPRGRFVSSTGQSATRPVSWWISTLCRISRNRK